MQITSSPSPVIKGVPAALWASAGRRADDSAQQKQRCSLCATLDPRMCQCWLALIATEERWSLEAGGRHQPGVWIGIFLVFASFSPFLTQKPSTSLSAPPRIPLGLSEVWAWALSWGWAVIQTEADNDSPCVVDGSSQPWLSLVCFSVFYLPRGGLRLRPPGTVSPPSRWWCVFWLDTQWTPWC